MFEPINLEWHGKPVSIPANRVLGAIATIEGVMTYNELQDFAMRGAYPAARVAAAYGALLRYAGEVVTDEQVYAGLFADEEATELVVGSMRLLMMLMIPPSLRVGKQVKPVLAPGENPAGNSRAAKTRASSRASSRSSSRKTGARR